MNCQMRSVDNSGMPVESDRRDSGGRRTRLATTAGPRELIPVVAAGAAASHTVSEPEGSSSTLNELY